MKRVLTLVLAIVIGALASAYFLFPGLMLEVGQKHERGKANLVEQEIRVGAFNMVYLDSDPTASKPETILMVHGFGADKDNWTRFARFFNRDYRVIAPDLPGHGSSSRLPSESYGHREQVERLQQFVQQLGLEKFHIVGNSMGGHISAIYAHQFPERVISLGLFNNAGVQSPQPSELTLALQEGRNPLLVDSVEDFDRLLAFVFVEPPQIPSSLKRYFAKAAVKNRDFNAKIFADLSKDGGTPLEPLLPQIQTPTLVLWGDTDRLLHVSSTQVLAALLPNAEVVIMEKMGHSPMIERPAETAGHYRDFIKRTQGKSSTETPAANPNNGS